MMTNLFNQLSFPQQPFPLYTLTRLWLRMSMSPSNAEAILSFKAQRCKKTKTNINHVVLVLIRKNSLSTIIWVPICQGFNHFSRFFQTDDKCFQSIVPQQPISPRLWLRMSISPKPMLRLLSSKAQGRKYFWKPSKPCHVSIHWKALAEYSHMSTHLPGF